MSFTISVITATYNCADVLPILMKSLLAQSDKDFEWVVSDGGSTDGTLGFLNESRDLDSIIISGDDFGIYDALNRAIKISTGTHYIVAGSDDCLDENAIRQYRAALNRSGAPFVVANIFSKGRILKPKGGNLILNKQMVFIAGHSLGLLIRKDLHNQYGYYSKKYPIAADQYFLERAYISGENFHYADFLAGVFGEEGVSSTDVLGSLSESFRINVVLTGSLFSNLIIFLLRIVKHRKRISR